MDSRSCTSTRECIVVIMVKAHCRSLEQFVDCSFTWVTWRVTFWLSERKIACTSRLDALLGAKERQRNTSQDDGIVMSAKVSGHCAKVGLLPVTIVRLPANAFNCLSLLLALPLFLSSTVGNQGDTRLRKNALRQENLLRWTHLTHSGRVNIKCTDIWQVEGVQGEFSRLLVEAERVLTAYWQQQRQGDKDQEQETRRIRRCWLQGRSTVTSASVEESDALSSRRRQLSTNQMNLPILLSSSRCC